jgi:hypothetical protein
MNSRVRILCCLAAAIAWSACGAPMSGNDGGTTDAGADSGFPFTPSNVPLSALDLSNLGDIDIAQSNCVINSQSKLLD